MTKVNNGRIISTNNSSSSRAKADAVLARLDEMSAHLADEISCYNDDDAASIRPTNDPAAITDNNASGSAVKAKKRVDMDLTLLESMAEGKGKASRRDEDQVVVVYTSESPGGESNDESTVYEEISYSLSRLRRGERSNESKANSVDKKKTATTKQQQAAASGSAFAPLLPTLAEQDKQQELSLHHPMNSFDDDNDSDASSSLGEFSIEEFQEDVMFTEQENDDDIMVTTTTTTDTPNIMVEPLLRKPSPPSPKQQEKRQTGSPEENTHHHSIDRYVHQLNVENAGSLDDAASILEMQMSRTPKIRNNKRNVLVGNKNDNVGDDVGLDGNGGGSFFRDAADISVKSNSDRSVRTNNTTQSSAPEGDKNFTNSANSTADSSARKTSGWSLFNRASTAKQSEERIVTSDDTNSRGSTGMFSRAAPKQTKKQKPSKVDLDEECSQVSHFNPPSHLSIDIESADSSRSRRSKKRSTSPSSLSFDDATTNDILRAAIVLNKDDKIKRRRQGAFCGLFLVLIVAVSALTVLVHTNSVPTFLRGPLSKLGISPASPTTEVDSDEVDGGDSIAAIWYADFDQYKCVQQCEEGGGADSITCGGMMEEWEQGFDTVEECCLENFSSFIGKDWSLKDCIAVSIPVSFEKGTGGPTYMPTTDGEDSIEEMEATTNPTEEDDGVEHTLQSGTTPWATTGDYVLELDENFNPINPTTVAAMTTEFPESKTTAAAVLELDENFNPISPTTVAITTTKVEEATKPPAEEDHIAAVSESTVSVKDAEEDTYELVYYADFVKNECILAGLDTVESWTKSYSSEDECCLENFFWYKHGNCFLTMQPATDSPTSSVSPSSKPTAKPTVLIITPKPTDQPTSPQPTATVLVYIHFVDKCIEVDKATLKANAKMYDSEDECHLDHNLGEYQPTFTPTFSPTATPTEVETMDPSKSPSKAPNAVPKITSKAGIDNICTVEYCEHKMTSDYVLEYRVNIPDDSSVGDNECIGCSLSVKLTYDDVTSWIGLAFSTNGQMIGSEAVIGVPGMVPAKYYLGGKYDGAIQPMQQRKQTLVDPLIEVVDGQTILSFTKLLVEEDEIALSVGTNIFLWAHGTDVENTFHGGNKGSFNINLLKTGSSRSENDPETKSEEEVTTGKPSANPTARPSNMKTDKPSAKPTNEATDKPSMKPTVRITESPSNGPTTTEVFDPLMDLFVTISPNITESIQDTASPYYRAWNWLNKNPDLDAVTDERKVQRWVLALFYRFLHGDEWTFSEGWLEIAENSVDECTWYNVLCDSSGHVVSLDLRNNYLWGDIPSEIAFLDKCEYLGLSSNYLSVIQPAIFDMSNLKVLDMDDNGISFIPEDINTSLKLEELYLSHNKITTIPDVIFELETLKALYIFDNWISSTLPSKIGQLTSLEVLDLEMNYFTGTLPDELYNLSNLKSLFLFRNMFNGQFSPKFSSMSGLNVLDLSQNFFTGELPTEIGMFNNITELHLKNNMISGQLPSEVSKLTSLTVLDMSMNNLNSEIIAGIGELKNLITLRLDNNYRLDEEGALVSSGIKGTIPSSIGNLKQLRELRLDNNYIQGPLPSALGDLESLEILRIESNDVRGSIPSELGNAVNLQQLHLWSNYIEGTIPGSLGGLVKLQELFLDDNELTGTIPTELGRLVSANYICLASNNLDGTIPSELGRLQNIEKLELQSNYLYGEVPKELGSAPLVLLQLEENFLYGDIPEEVCDSNTIQYISGNCPALPEPTPAPVSLQTGNTNNALAARNGVRANNNVRNSVRTNGARTNNGARASRKRNGTRQRNKQTSRGLAQNTPPTPSPTLEYWWSCNCCSECLPVT